jgi:hypothetical protein
MHAIALAQTTAIGRVASHATGYIYNYCNIYQITFDTQIKAKQM